MECLQHTDWLVSCFQADVYKTDFYAERQAREEMNTLKENITEELEQKKAENMRLRARLAEQKVSSQRTL